MPDVTLKLSIGSFSVEVTGPQEYAEAKLEDLVGRYLTSSSRSTSSANTTATVEQAPSIALGSGGKQLSVAELLKKVPHKNQQDRALVLGYYAEHVSKQPNFTTSELADMGQSAKYPFTNVSESVSRLVARGLMMSAGDREGKRAYALTASGEAYLESFLNP